MKFEWIPALAVALLATPAAATTGASSPVSEPSALLPFGSGLLLARAVARRRRI